MCGLTFLSSSIAGLIGFESFRIYGLSILVLCLVLAALFTDPRVAVQNRLSTLLLILILIIVGFIDLFGDFTPLDYKILLPILMLMFAPNLSIALKGFNLGRLLVGILAVYVSFTFTLFVLLGPENLYIGFGAFRRIDITGSIVTHSSLCLIFVAAASAHLYDAKYSRVICAIIILMIMASIFMIVSTATRTVLATLSILAVLLIICHSRPAETAIRCIIALVGAVLIFAAYSYAISDTFWLRLTGAQGDFSSGRAHSVAHWLARASESPLGLGFGSIRDAMESGKPVISNGRPLEWPHNEFIRFWIESGPLGLLLILGFCTLLTARTLRAAQFAGNRTGSTLVLILTADLIARSLLQNYFNSVYDATVLVAVLVVQQERLLAAKYPGSACVITPFSWPWLSASASVPQERQGPPQVLIPDRLPCASRHARRNRSLLLAQDSSWSHPHRPFVLKSGRDFDRSVAPIAIRVRL